MIRRSAERGEEVEESSLFGLSYTLEIQDLAEIGVRLIGDVDEVGLDKGFGGRRTHLEGFEEGVDFGHGLIHTFYKASGGRGQQD